MKTTGNIVNRKRYRPNVGMAILNADNNVFVGKRIKSDNRYKWQMPQGGVDKGEAVEQALWRELYEETGINNTVAQIIATVPNWLYYDIPKKQQRNNFAGQKQKWFILRFNGSDDDISLNCHNDVEFSSYEWIPHQRLPDIAIPFKRNIYKQIRNHITKIINSKNLQQNSGLK
jgi:putative (di)nucleoside polyphosphate hydrolase